LLNYEGTFIIVSHDREFVDGLTNRIWDIEHQSLKIHHFTLNEYLSYKMKEKSNVVKDQKTKETAKIKEIEKHKPIEKVDDKKQNNQKELQRLEKDITSLEYEIKKVEEDLANLDYNSQTYSNNLSLYEDKKRDLDQLMLKWERLL
jgi:ATP-binding cassette subfamily F protein 3